MKRFFFITLALLLAACQPATIPPQDLQTAVAATVAVELTAVGQAAVLPTWTASATPPPSPTPTITPTVVPTATATATPVPTPTPAPTVAPTPIPDNCSGVRNAAYVADVTIPDYSQVKAGETFTKIWAVQNTGDCTWQADYALRFKTGEAMDGQPIPIGQTVQPGEIVNVSVQMTAPEQRGVHTGAWQLTTARGIPFGETLTVLIIVEP